jgi:hypothetical protein
MTKARDIASAIPAPSTVDATELGYLDGVTSAIQTQLDAKTAKSTLTTTGDIYYASSANTPARLAIGSTSDVLTVVAGVPGWAAPAGSGLVLLNTTTFSAVASASCSNDVFSTTYIHYVVRLNIISSASPGDISMRVRASGSDYTGANYRQQRFSASSTTVSGSRDVSQSFWKLGDTGSANYNFFLLNLSNMKQTVAATGYGLTNYDASGNIEIANRTYGMTDTSAYDAITFFPVSGTITGEFSIYGMSK